MNARLNITGQTFGHLTAIEFVDADGGAARWRFRCACLKEVVLVAKAVKHGSPKSCGCIARAASAQRCRARARHGMTDTPTWRSWSHMLDRCNNPNHAKYSRYGGRGIKVCERWSVFEHFLADMGLRPEGRTLDRYPNPDGDYEPDNCRWATALEQCHNRSNSRSRRLVAAGYWPASVEVPDTATFPKEWS